MQKNIDPTNNNNPNPIILNLNDKWEESTTSQPEALAQDAAGSVKQETSETAAPGMANKARSTAEEMSKNARDAAQNLNAKTQEATTKLQGTAQEISNNTRDMFSSMSNKFKAWTAKTQETVGEISDAARTKAQEVGSKVQGSMTSTSADGDVADAPKGLNSKMQDAAAYKAFLYNLGQRVAQAVVEGGFLGIGGQLVSNQEAALLRD